jgi:DNA mismatch endonuclease, patch repair protein
MSSVRSTGNRAELILRSLLWRRGYRFRLQRRDIIGRPDIVLPGLRTVIFVDGDFWHGRVLREGGEDALRCVIRGNKFPWWRDKLANNVRRDRVVSAALRKQGWVVIRIWESEILASPVVVADRVAKKLSQRKKSMLVASVTDSKSPGRKR